MNMNPTSLRPTMASVTSAAGVRVSFERSGTGPPLVLVHGGFDNHLTNWQFVQPLWRDHFTVYAVARRGRGATDATERHSVEDEARDVAAVIRHVGEPVFLLGHSYGAIVALAAAHLLPDHVRRLVLYEPPWPKVARPELLEQLEALAKARQWDRFAESFFLNGLFVPRIALDAVRASEAWPHIVADARASLGDVRALARFRFDPDTFRSLTMPVLLQMGSESRHELYVTEALAGVLPDVRVKVLRGQGHEGPTTAPEMFADSVVTFLLR